MEEMYGSSWKSMQVGANLWRKYMEASQSRCKSVEAHELYGSEWKSVETYGGNTSKLMEKRRSR